MSAKKTATKTAKKTASKTVAASAAFKKGDIVKFVKWSGKPPEDSEEIVKGMVGKVRTVSDDEIEVALTIDGETVIVPFGTSEIAIASKADIAKSKAAAEDEEEEDEESEEEESDDDAEDEEEEEEEEEEGPSIGDLADEGDKKAIRELTKAAKSAGVDPDDYQTWVEVEAAIAADDDESEEEEEESEEEEEDEAEASPYDDMSVKELRRTCVEREIDKTGDKDALIARLVADDNGEEEEEDEEESEEEEEDEDDAVVEDGTKGKKGSREVKPKREPSLGKLADGEDKVAVRELTKRCKAVDVDPDDFETWVEVERALKPIEKEAARPQLKITASVQEEIGEEGQDAVTAAKRLVETAERTYYTLGGVLGYIDRNKTYESIKIKGEKPYQGQPGFEAFCEEHLGIAYRKAKYLIAIYEAMTGAGLSEKKISTIGWSKAKELVAIFREEPDQADKWIEKAKASSTLALAEAVKARLTKIGAKVHGGSAASVRSVACKFTVHQDEGKVIEKALAMAKEQMDSTSDSEAFAYIVKEWIAYQG